MALSLCEENADSNSQNHEQETLPLNIQPPRISCICFIDLRKTKSIMALPRDSEQIPEFGLSEP